MGIGQWIAENITEPLEEMIINSVNAFIITFLQDLVNALTGVMQHELELANSLLEHPYFVSAVQYSQVIALSLLAARIAFEAFQTYIAYSTGEENHPGQLLKKIITALAVITSIPWITKQVFMFSFSIVDDIQGFASVTTVSNIQEALFTCIFTVSTAVNLPLALLVIIGLILWLVVLIQMSVRAVNVGILMVIGPFLWAMQNELGGSWFKALLSQCLAMPVQMFLLRGALSSVASTASSPAVGALLFIGFMWATVKFPAFLQQLVAQTGVGGAIGGTAQHVGTTVLLRRMITRG